MKEFSHLPRERFGDNDAMADELATLVRHGIKTATCSAYKPDEPTVQLGQQTIIENSIGEHICIIETTAVNILKFSEVDETFAYAEGEGDRSLNHWRQAHQEFFSRNGGFSEDMLLVCEQFKVIKTF